MILYREDQSSKIHSWNNVFHQLLSVLFETYSEVRSILKKKVLAAHNHIILILIQKTLYIINLKVISVILRLAV